MTETNPCGDYSFEQAVRETAYFLWEQDGKPSGREQEHWCCALEQHLRERRADAAISAKPIATHQADDNIDDLGRPINADS